MKVLHIGALTVTAMQKVTIKIVEINVFICLKTGTYPHLTKVMQLGVVIT